MVMGEGDFRPPQRSETSGPIFKMVIGEGDFQIIKTVMVMGEGDFRPPQIRDLLTDFHDFHKYIT